MSDHYDSPYLVANEGDETASPPPNIGYTRLSWGIIVLLVGAIVSLQSAVKSREPNGQAPNDQFVFRIMELQGKYLVGAAQLPGAGGGMLYEQAQDLDTGPVRNRLGFVTLAGELAGPQEALQQLDELERKISKATATDLNKKSQNQNGAGGAEQTWAQPALREALRRLYDDYAQGNWAAPSLSDADRMMLRRDLGWFGALALAPREAGSQEQRSLVIAPAQRTTVAIVVMVLLGLGAAVVGFAGFLVLLGLWINGRLASGILPAMPHSGVYAETFVCWMLLYMGLSMAVAFSPLGEHRMLLAVFVMLASAAALGWPVLRGVGWRQVCRDMGCFRGRSGWLEPLWGVVCYFSTIPLLLLGMAVMWVLLLAQGAFGAAASDELRPTDLPAHPIVDSLATADAWQWAQLLLLACVAAPLLEETMFRGALYRNLRDWSAGWRIGASVAFAAAANSFVFAAIHPQGLIAVPPLMALAIGFSLAREWRGSLIAPVIAHGLNNAIVMCVVMLIL